jgi:PHD/YefM family antitoxin component YafN of YafNO toxin-antitoxin module
MKMEHSVLDRAETSAEMTMTEFRERVTRMPEELTREGWTSLAVTRRGRPVLAVIPWELYESIIETMEILGDEKMMAALRQGVEDIKAGRTYSMEEMWAELERES